MELSINEDEIKEVLLEWSRGPFGEAFNVVEFEFRYGSFEAAIFSKKEPPIDEEAANLINKAKNETESAPQ